MPRLGLERDCDAALRELRETHAESAVDMIRLAFEAGMAGGSIEDASNDPKYPIYEFGLAVERIAQLQGAAYVALSLRERLVRALGLGPGAGVLALAGGLQVWSLAALAFLVGAALLLPEGASYEVLAAGLPSEAERLLAQLAYGFRERPTVRYGLSALCVGMGMGAALVWENLAAGH